MGTLEGEETSGAEQEVGEDTTQVTLLSRK